MPPGVSTGKSPRFPKDFTATEPEAILDYLDMMMLPYTVNGGLFAYSLKRDIDLQAKRSIEFHRMNLTVLLDHSPDVCPVCKGRIRSKRAYAWHQFDACLPGGKYPVCAYHLHCLSKVKCAGDPVPMGEHDEFPLFMFPDDRCVYCFVNRGNSVYAGESNICQNCADALARVDWVAHHRALEQRERQVAQAA